ncbi:MAG: DUF2461 family protein [Candidatus Acidiferrales bacterium]
MTRSQGIFTGETFRFFRELSRNNHKAWMDENRERYRTHLVEPFRVLLDRLAPVARQLNPQFAITGRTGVNFSRINRDIRFSKEKSPYRTHYYLEFADLRAEEPREGQLYVGVSIDTVTAGFRAYLASKNSAIARVGVPRACENHKWLKRQARRLGKKYDSYWYSSEKGEWRKHDGWPLDPEDWKRLKGWIVRRQLKTSAALHPNFHAEAARIFREVFPLYQFALAENWKA